MQASTGDITAARRKRKQVWSKRPITPTPTPSRNGSTNLFSMTISKISWPMIVKEKAGTKIPIQIMIIKTNKTTKLKNNYRNYIKNFLIIICGRNHNGCSEYSYPTTCFE